MSRGKILLSVLALAAAGALGCCFTSPSAATRDTNIPLPKEIVQANHAVDGESEIYLAGGCFWGTEELLRHVHGVKSVEVGYANGATQIRRIATCATVQVTRKPFMSSIAPKKFR